MKARLPKKHEFLIHFEEHYDKQEECWQKLNEILEDYKKQGKSTYTPTYVEDNEPKVKELQKTYEFTYTIREV